MSQTSAQIDGWAFCDGILPDVSRSFALIIPRCPPPIDRALCVAYLICRLADTVEDEPSLDQDQRAILYDALLRAVDEPTQGDKAVAFTQAWPVTPDGAYGRLTHGAHFVLAAFASLPAELRQPIQTCVHDMVSGMRTIRPVETKSGVSFLCRDLDDLERYCHIVAGTVGIMSTTLFEKRFDPATFTPSAPWREQGRRLGLGLQMTNIIKDCHSDAARGVSFIPARYVDFDCTSYQLQPAGQTKLIGHTIAHLDEAMAYVRAVPPTETGIRTFLLGSMLPAMATLEVAANASITQPKIDRAKMGEIFTCIEQHNADNDALATWYDHHRQRTLAALNKPPNGD